MKNRQVLEIQQALQRLDGCAMPGSNAVVPYRFTVAVTYAIGKNLNRIASIVKDTQDTYNRLLRALMKPGEAGIKKDDARIVGLTEEFDKVLEEESDFTPHMIALTGLNIGVGQTQNQIPPTVIAVLEPLITDDTLAAPTKT